MKLEDQDQPEMCPLSLSSMTQMYGKFHVVYDVD